MTIGQAVRYKPGKGTYGYEEWIQTDGRIPGVVVAVTPHRVRVRLDLGQGREKTATVDADSLVVVS